MAKKRFKNLSDMYEQFQKDAISSVNDIAPQIMKDTMVEAIKIEVYARYEPTEYERRLDGEGGLMNQSNMQHELVVTDKSVKILLFNYAKGHEDVGDDYYDYIGDIIASGEGYTWERSKIYKSKMPRDFYTVTEELLKKTDIIQQIKKEMKRKGW